MIRVETDGFNLFDFSPVTSKAGRFTIIHEESFKSIGLSSNVYIVELSGKSYLFDAGGNPELLSFLRAFGIQPDRLGSVFLTHGHRDHIAGLRSLLRFGVTAYIAGEDMALLGEGLGSAHQTGGVRDLSEGEGLLRSLGFQAMRTPGHTGGSTCFYCAAEHLLVSGDTVFADGYFGRTDLKGGNNAEMLRSLKMLSGLAIESILPGHGRCVLNGGRSSISAALVNATYLLRSRFSPPP